MFTSIVTAIDGSPHSDKALDTACDIAKRYGAELHLVHVPQLDTTTIAAGYGVVLADTPTDDIARAGKAIMAAAVTRCAEAGITPTNTQIGDGPPVQEILVCAKLQDADLIVMGRRGLSGLRSLLLGSVSGAVAHEATCSLLTVQD